MSECKTYKFVIKKKIGKNPLKHLKHGNEKGKFPHTRFVINSIVVKLQRALRIVLI